MNICFSYLELPFFVCHHTCCVILPADPNCLPKGCISLAVSPHGVSHLGALLAESRKKRTASLSHETSLCCCSGPHCYRDPQPAVGLLNPHSPCLPKEGMGAAQVPLSCTRVGLLGQPKWWWQLPKVASVMDAGRSSLPEHLPAVGNGTYSTSHTLWKGQQTAVV